MKIQKPTKKSYNCEVKVFFNRPNKALSINGLIKDIKQAKNSVFIAAAWFTRRGILSALIESHAKTRVLVLGKHDQDGTWQQRKRQQNLFDNLQWGTSYNHFPVDVHFIGSDKWQEGIMHHKFIIIDEDIVWTGSYNFTNGAERNFENLIRIKDTKVNHFFRDEVKEIIKGNGPVTFMNDDMYGDHCYACGKEGLDDVENGDLYHIHLSKKHSPDNKSTTTVICDSCIKLKIDKKPLSHVDYYMCDTCDKIFPIHDFHTGDMECDKCSMKKYKHDEDHREEYCLLCGAEYDKDFTHTTLWQPYQHSNRARCVCSKCFNVNITTEEYDQLASKLNISATKAKQKFRKRYTHQTFLCFDCGKKHDWKDFYGMFDGKLKCIHAKPLMEFKDVSNGE